MIAFNSSSVCNLLQPLDKNNRDLYWQWLKNTWVWNSYAGMKLARMKKKSKGLYRDWDFSWSGEISTVSLQQFSRWMEESFSQPKYHQTAGSLLRPWQPRLQQHAKLPSRWIGWGLAASWRPEEAAHYQTEEGRYKVNLVHRRRRGGPGSRMTVSLRVRKYWKKKKKDSRWPTQIPECKCVWNDFEDTALTCSLVECA